MKLSDIVSLAEQHSIGYNQNVRGSDFKVVKGDDPQSHSVFCKRQYDIVVIGSGKSNSNYIVSMDTPYCFEMAVSGTPTQANVNKSARVMPLSTVLIDAISSSTQACYKEPVEAAISYVSTMRANIFSRDVTIIAQTHPTIKALSSVPVTLSSNDKVAVSKLEKEFNKEASKDSGSISDKTRNKYNKQLDIVRNKIDPITEFLQVLAIVDVKDRSIRISTSSNAIHIRSDDQFPMRLSSSDMILVKSSVDVSIDNVAQIDANQGVCKTTSYLKMGTISKDTNRKSNGIIGFLSSVTPSSNMVPNVMSFMRGNPALVYDHVVTEAACAAHMFAVVNENTANTHLLPYIQEKSVITLHQYGTNGKPSDLGIHDLALSEQYSRFSTSLNDSIANKFPNVRNLTDDVFSSDVGLCLSQIYRTLMKHPHTSSLVSANKKYFFIDGNKNIIDAAVVSQEFKYRGYNLNIVCCDGFQGSSLSIRYKSNVESVNNLCTNSISQDSVCNFLLHYNVPQGDLVPHVLRIASFTGIISFLTKDATDSSFNRIESDISLVGTDLYVCMCGGYLFLFVASSSLPLRNVHHYSSCSQWIEMSTEDAVVIRNSSIGSTMMIPIGIISTR